ncbi:MAG TPA: hypothetical protein VD970_18920 [Acetobacteraceae bacterium]|nr:hypothetical protein [Acetobacteraceae bacterium]
MDATPVPPEVAALLTRLTGAAPVETHGAAVFVGPEAAYKVKKPVRFGYLDFSTLDARERMLRRELALNAPQAPGLYRAVLPVTRGPDRALRLGGEGPAEEWVLEMAPLGRDDFLDAVAARGDLSPAMLDALTDTVVAMHAAAPVMRGWDAPRAVARVMRETRDAALHAGLPALRIHEWAGGIMAALDRLGPLLAQRAAEGRVRRCHGDLHLANLCLWQGRPTPFDALEFSEALATVDTGYDLAFLLMDLEVRLGRATANRVLNRYVARTGDAALVGALPLWLSLRAMIRAHVAATRGADALPLLAWAEAVLSPAPARLVAIGGLQGTGKSRLARLLAPAIGPAPGALVLRSDEGRKRLFGRAPE